MTEAEVLEEYADLFDGVGLLEGDVHFDVDDTVPAIQMPLRRLPIAVRDKVEAELKRLESDGIIARVTEPTKWVSALLVVAKPDGRIRTCIDLQYLNKALKRVQYCMPTIDDVLPKLTGVKILSSIDTKEGIFHLKLDRESSLLTTTETPFGRIRWLRVPFGVKVAPEIFADRIHAALSGLNNIAIIVDDILVAGSG